MPSAKLSLAVEVKQGATVIATFGYDADGRRTSMTTSSGTGRFFYDDTGTRVLYETDGSGNVLARYAYGPSGQLLAMVRGGATYSTTTTATAMWWR